MKVLRYIPLFVVLFLAGFLFRALYLDPSDVPSALVDKKAPEVKVSELYHPDTQFDVSLFKGHVSILNVWASWCHSCMQEHLFLMELSGKNEVAMYGLNYKDERPAAKEMLQRFGNPYQRVAFDKKGQMGAEWGVYGTPETFLIDATGTIRHKHMGPLNQAIWDSEFSPLIKEMKKV